MAPKHQTWRNRAWELIRHVATRFDRDHCLSLAAALSYTTLLALVPLLTLALGLLTGFPAFRGVEQRIEALVIRNLVPEASQSVMAALTSFVDNAGQATGVGVIGLAVTSVMLLATINSAFTAIFRAERERPLGIRLLVYWAIVSLGPILFGASLSLSGAFDSEVLDFGGVDALEVVGAVLPFLLQAFGFAVLYVIAPNRPVRWADAGVAGLFAAVMFEGLKFGFGIYLQNFDAYESIYGALAAIPIFLLWMYLCWAVTLLGAELAASLPEWRAAAVAVEDPGRAPRPGERLGLALALLDRLLAASREGRALPDAELMQGLTAPARWIDEEREALCRAGLIDRTAEGNWVIVRDLDAISLAELVRLIGVGLAPDDVAAVASGSPWEAVLGEWLAEIEPAERAMLGVPVKSLLASRSDVPEPLRAAARGGS